MSSYGIGNLPTELTCHPLAYVAVIGLNVNNSTHNAIWDSLNTNRLPEKVPLCFRRVTEGYEFPKPKAKRTTYDWYIPKGILKTNWMAKCLYHVPAVAVLFYDLDWNDSSWAEKRDVCAKKLEILRSSLQGRSTKVALVLIQRQSSHPVGDDGLASERAAALCSACELSVKTLFILPQSDHLFGYTLRLESAFYELAQLYYLHEIQIIKNHRESLNKTTHQLLFPRHQFKMAFLSELKQNIAHALKYYKQAYLSLLEVQATDFNIMEIKTIAGFINYKFCRLSFINNTPLDAISQFRKHIDIFKSKVGPQELAFEHSAWLSKQFSHFGDIFDEAVKQGLIPIQTQHPGFYYQEAANHATSRKHLCQKLCQVSLDYPNPDPLLGIDTMDYYGQRPWRQFNQNIDAPDALKESDGIKALQHQEITSTNHSMIVIPLLSSAIAQFKKYKCPRMKRQLMVQMAEEYYSCRDYGKALTLLKHVLWDFRGERWKLLVSSILNTALKCAYLSGSIQEYITLGLESISSWIQGSTEEKSLTQTSINNVLNDKPPFPLPGLNEIDIAEAEKHWQESMLPEKLPVIFTAEMGSVIPFVECRAGFTSKSFYADQKILVKVYLRMNCPQPMTFSKLSILFNNAVYNKKCEIPASEDGSCLVGSSGTEERHLYLVPRKLHMFTFSFLPVHADINSDIQIAFVALQMGSETKICTVLHWTLNSNDFAFTGPTGNKNIKGLTMIDDPSFYQLVVEPVTRVLPRNPHVTIDVRHEPPVLLNEFYVLDINISSEEIHNINNVLLTIGLQEEVEQHLCEKTHFSEEPEFKGKCSSLLPNCQLQQMTPGEKVNKKIYLKATSLSLLKIFCKISYDIDTEVDDEILHYSCNKVENLEIQTVEPFKFAVKLLNMKFEPQQYIRAEEPFLLKVDITSCSALPIYFEDGLLALSPHAECTDENITSPIRGLTLYQKEAASECFCLIAQSSRQSPLLLGSYILQWKRKISQHPTVPVQTTVSLPTARVTAVPIYMELELPSHGWVRTPMTITYFLHNRMTSVQDMELLIDSSDAFMYAGNKQLHFRVLPKQKYKLTYNLYPLMSGFVPLPKLRLILNPATSNALSLEDLIQEMVPTHVFIMPQGKGDEYREEHSIQSQ